MSLVSLSDGWKQYGEGRRWRCISPSWYCEVDRENNIPSYLNLTSSVNIVKKVRAFYSGKIFTSMADEHGNLVDLLTANAMAESFGTVPTPFSKDELTTVLQASKASDMHLALAELVDYILLRSKYLVRKEPGYSDPVSTPGRISIGAHHVLLSTAVETLNLPFSTENTKVDTIKKLIIELSSSSVYAAEMALTYFQKRYAKHLLEPPLMAAIYNAGSLRPSSNNTWNLVQYGDHLDRWVGYYNTSRSIAFSQPAVTVKSDPPATPAALELKVIRKIFSEQSTIGEFYIGNNFHCYTLEDIVRPDGTKIYGDTAIPAGRYEVIVNMSTRFKKEMPLLLNVPGFDGIRIHSGNTAADTLGCILVGKNKGVDRIWECKNVFDQIVEKIKSVTPQQKCFLSISSST
jgi:hypothetical protein